jgi:hypothetical protein
MNDAGNDLAIRAWLDSAWSRARRLAVLEGGESDIPVARRRPLFETSEVTDLRAIGEWLTTGLFTGDICRCPGELTFALYDDRRETIGSGTLHGERVSWERRRFQNDLRIRSVAPLYVYLSKVGINGSSRALLGSMIEALGLEEGEIQFRPAADRDALAARRVPPGLHDEVADVSGDRAAKLDDNQVEKMLILLGADSDPPRAVHQLLAWLGAATWPAEALSGDGQLARRMLDRFDLGTIERVLQTVTDPHEVMGAVAWAAHREDDARFVTALGPAIERLLP